MLSDEFEPVSKFGAQVHHWSQSSPPLSQLGSPVGLEVIAGVEVAFLVEVVVDGGVDRGEHL